MSPVGRDGFSEELEKLWHEGSNQAEDVASAKTLRFEIGTPGES